MIYTSYFAMLHKMSECRNPISIARITPYYLRDKLFTFSALAPSWGILNEYKNSCIMSNKGEERYTERFYKEILDHLNPDQIVRELGENPVLFCYERSEKFCHRHLVADWLRKAGYSVEEWSFQSAIFPG